MTTRSDPHTQPLTYPGDPIRVSGVLVGESFLPAPARDIQNVLADLDAIPLQRRSAVIAIGSNASKAQLIRKLRPQNPTVGPVPITCVRVQGLAAGVSAHVSRPGYIPATPIPAPGETASLVMAWLDSDQLTLMDETEPNYDRCLIDPRRFPVEFDTAEIDLSPMQWIYVSKHGYLVGDDGNAWRLSPQRELIGMLLSRSAALRHLAGSTPQTFISAMRNPDARDRVRELFRKEFQVRTHGPWATRAFDGKR